MPPWVYIVSPIFSVGGALIAWTALTVHLQKEFARMSNTLVTRAQLDEALTQLGPTLATTLTTALGPIVERLNGMPQEDFSAELAILQGLPALINQDIAALFAPTGATGATSSTEASAG